MTQLLEVQGPLDPEQDEFITNILDEIRDLKELQFKDGDIFHVPLSCPGYDIGDITLKEKQVPNPYARGETYPDFITDVILKPKDPTKAKTIDPKKNFRVVGLQVKGGNLLRFTLSESDELSEFIKFDSNTGNIIISTFLEDQDDEVITFAQYPYYKYNKRETTAFREMWEKHSKKPIKEGIVYMDKMIPDELHSALNSQLDALSTNEPVDWHPGSNECVRDLVHPSLYPLVKGESTVTEEGQQLLEEIANPIVKDEGKYMNREGKQTDRWGRLYEESIYQWLPSVFRTEIDGQVHIETYINNLDQDKYANLYELLEKLFEHFLPMFEQIYSYSRATKYISIDAEEDEVCETKYEYEPNLEEADLKGKSLRVITKIVEYVLTDEQSSIDGVFHVEGMSSDHILATATYTLSKDENMDGGDLEFRRSMMLFEASYIYWNIPQLRHWKAEEIVDEGIVPLGMLPTSEKRGIVFPNSHIHRLTPMRCKPSCKNQRRRAIIFWLIDPEANVLSTEHVPKQQNGSMSHERALWHRLQLMEERKKHKGKFNTERKISLCEH